MHVFELKTVSLTHLVKFIVNVFLVVTLYGESVKTVVQTLHIHCIDINIRFFLNLI